MTTTSQRPVRDQGGALSALNEAIRGLNTRNDLTTTKEIYDSVSILLTMIRVSSLFVHAGQLPPNVCTQDSMIRRFDCVELGLACADVCVALERGVDNRSGDEADKSASETIERLTT